MVIFSCVFDDFTFKILEVPIGALWGHFGLLLEVFLSPLGVLWAPFGVTWGPLGSLWTHFGTLGLPLGSLWSSFGLTLDALISLWGHFGPLRVLFVVPWVSNASFRHDLQVFS